MAKTGKKFQTQTLDKSQRIETVEKLKQTNKDKNRRKRNQPLNK